MDLYGADFFLIGFNRKERYSTMKRRRFLDLLKCVLHNYRLRKPECTNHSGGLKFIIEKEETLYMILVQYCNTTYFYN